MENISQKKKIKMQRKMENHRSPKNLQKYAQKKNSRNYHLQNMKQNINLTKFTTTDLKQLNTEFKLYTIRHNLKKNI